MNGETRCWGLLAFTWRAPLPPETRPRIDWGTVISKPVPPENIRFREGQPWRPASQGWGDR